MNTLSTEVHDWAGQGELMQQHQEAIECFDVQDQIRKGLALLARLRETRSSHIAATRAGQPPSQRERYDLFQMFQSWYIPVPYVVADIWRCRARGHWVDGAKELEEAIAWYRENICDVDEMLRRAHMGDSPDSGRPFSEVRGELRRPA